MPVVLAKRLFHVVESWQLVSTPHRNFSRHAVTRPSHRIYSSHSAVPRVRLVYTVRSCLWGWLPHRIFSSQVVAASSRFLRARRVILTEKARKGHLPGFSRFLGRRWFDVVRARLLFFGRLPSDLEQSGCCCKLQVSCSAPSFFMPSFACCARGLRPRVLRGSQSPRFTSWGKAYRLGRALYLCEPICQQLHADTNCHLFFDEVYGGEGTLIFSKEYKLPARVAPYVPHAQRRA